MRAWKEPEAEVAPESGSRPSRLRQWPVQLHLLPVEAPFFEDSRLLIAADCVAHALAGFHEELLAGHSLAIACPKMDNTEPYIEKLTAIFQRNTLREITVAIMEVPCCMGLLMLVRQALQRSGQDIPLHLKVVSIEGNLLDSGPKVDLLRRMAGVA